MDAIMYALTALAWALWWWLFREARRMDKAQRIVDRVKDGRQ